MLTYNEISNSISETESELIKLKQFELNNLKNLLNFLEENPNEIRFSLELSKKEAETYNISKFNIKDCMDAEVQEGFKKMLKIRIDQGN